MPREIDQRVCELTQSQRCQITVVITYNQFVDLLSDLQWNCQEPVGAVVLCSSHLLLWKMQHRTGRIVKSSRE